VFRLYGTQGNRRDVSPAKVEMLDSGRTPIVEARLARARCRSNKACRLHAATDATQSGPAFRRIVCLRGHPSLKNGKLDLSHIENVATELEPPSAKESAACSFLRAQCCRHD